MADRSTRSPISGPGYMIIVPSGFVEFILNSEDETINETVKPPRPKKHMKAYRNWWLLSTFCLISLSPNPDGHEIQSLKPEFLLF